ncbi:hypothetical protein, variant 1 [Aphanomyces astaci]|uniref:Magnesium transporter n=1 Tax=Aphanomyces astaci TaxID=112090 RepID=W4H5H5_APHAT|nr:hypothetical protein, variant 1 [Aphanomyces astaci]ETV87147.1 hypothetical protein, variant 1 [Aphanomyces astaci]|eukprot:XP_009823947.1 hypothetical protein, variant 1 [Aphanomyces astaci]
MASAMNGSLREHLLGPEIVVVDGTVPAAVGGIKAVVHTGGRDMAWQFDMHGQCFRRHVSREDVFREIQDAASSSSGGDVSIPGVHMRDIRQLDSAYSISDRPTILVRHQAILVNIDPIRAVILRHRCIVFPGMPLDVATHLQATFVANMAESPDAPFEFTALESVLSTVATWYANQVTYMQPEAMLVLQSIASVERPRDEFERLRLVQRRFHELQAQVQGIHSLLAALLDDDDDLHRLYLTKLHGNQNVDSYISSTFDPDEAASLVEVYVQKTFSTLCTIQLQLTKADNTESSLDLKWTSKRNQLLLVDIPLKLVYLALWVASFWTAAMAMNVASPFSTLDDGGMFFWSFFGGLAGLCVVFVLVAVVHLRRQGIRLTFAAPVEVPSVAAAIAAASTMSTLSSSSAAATDDDDDDGRRPALHFDTTGNYTTTFVTRSAIFNMVQCAAADVQGYADPTQSDEYYHTPVDIPPMHMRDIRTLETALSVSNEPMITVRQQVILINCDPIRAVIFRDSCLVFISRGLVTSTTLVQRLQASFHQHLGDDAHACVGFEFSALEAIVATKCQLLADEQYKLAVLGRDQLNLMASDEGNMSVLDNLRMIKNATSDLESQVNGVRRMLIDMLDDDEELHMLHLTKLYEEPSVALDLFGFDTEEVESLLESYLQVQWYIV